MGVGWEQGDARGGARNREIGANVVNTSELDLESHVTLERKQDDQMAGIVF